MIQTWAIERFRGPLPDDLRDSVMELLRIATHHDGQRPLSEHATLHLRFGGDRDVTHWIVRGDNEVRGYLHLDGTDAVAGPSAEVVVLPDMRSRGIGSALINAAVAECGEQPIRLWAHGDSPEAANFARSRGFTRQRSLLQLRRSLYAPLPKALLPTDVQIRSFRAGHDEQPWLELNRAAFAHLPDQASWTLADFTTRIQEPWFDPAGLLIAEDADGHIVGTHWTKVHGAASHNDHVHEPIGEVYVLAVASTARGTGLGRALTILGLEHLRDLGLDAVMLYVDAANTSAIHVYEALGFTQWDVDVLYRRSNSH